MLVHHNSWSRNVYLTVNQDILHVDQMKLEGKRTLFRSIIMNWHLYLSGVWFGVDLESDT